MSRRRGTQHRRPRQQVRRCRVCGCTGATACPGGCWWADVDLCSSCAYVERGVADLPTPAPGMERFKCGCLMGVVGEAFVMEPCSGRCDVFIYAVRHRERGRPIDVIDASDVAL